MSKRRRSPTVDSEEDFMSDKFLSAAASSSTMPTYTDRRAKALARAHDGSRKTKALSKQELTELEREKRAEGLARDLMREETSDAAEGNAAKGQDHGRNKALAMMRAMGYAPGQSLGANAQRTSSSEEKDDMTGIESGSSASRSIVPIAPDERWLSSSSRRRGLGSAGMTVSKAISAAAANEEAKTSEDRKAAELEAYRGRASGKHEERKVLASLGRARTTTERLDREGGTEYSPLWLDATWFSPGYTREPPLQVQELLEAALGSDTDMIVPAGASMANQEEINVEAVERKERREEARRWASLDAPIRLRITLSHLRSTHYYCIWCGCAYENPEDLQASCPGEEEDDH